MLPLSTIRIVIYESHIWGEIRIFTNFYKIYLLTNEYNTFSNQYMDPQNNEVSTATDVCSLVKEFWALVKGRIDLPYVIQKGILAGIFYLLLEFITG